MSQKEEENRKTEGSAYLAPGERRALLEDIGHIAYTLSQSASKESKGEEAGARQKEALISASASPRPRDRAIVSLLERLHLLRALWRQQQSALAAILNGADTRLVQQAQSVLLAQARGGPKAADTIAQSPRLAAAWALADGCRFFPVPGARTGARNRTGSSFYTLHKYLGQSPDCPYPERLHP